MKQIIAGYGYVGKAIEKLFPTADIYDPKFPNDFPQQDFDHIVIKQHYKNPPSNYYDYAHLCCPTPMKKDGSCNTTAVEDVISKITADLYICHSTVPPGTIDRLESKAKGPLQKLPNIVLCPEYIASHTKYPAPLGDIHKMPFVILGGRKENTKKARALYETVYPPTTEIFECSARTAEIIKLCENTAIANKVTLAQEFYDICKSFNVYYSEVQKGVFGLDPRFTTYWTNIYPHKRGFSDSSCLPKDLSNLIVSCETVGYIPKFLYAIQQCNDEFNSRSIK